MDIEVGWFVVSAGRRRLPAVSARAAHESATALRAELPGAEVSWRLRPDAPAAAQFTGRYRPLPGLPNSRRVAHLFLLWPGVAVGLGTALRGLCGEVVRADLLEVLPGTVGGMPCYGCLAEIPVPSMDLVVGGS